MHWLDFMIFGCYMAGVLTIGFYFFHKNVSREDYYVGNRQISSFHVGLSVVATDVGGGFSIGLGGLGFLMGLSGSWLLFTGLVGAWLTAVLIIPRLKRIDKKLGLLTFPDFLRHHYGSSVALAAALISGIGYLGFTGAQILAGAKLAAGTMFFRLFPDNPLQGSLYIIAGIIILYTVLGGLKAVIYTDTAQWIILMTGLTFFALPFSLHRAGGWQAVRNTLPDAYFTLANVGWVQLVNWFVTIIPIWFIGMTLYQRIYACRNAKEAQKAWFIAGLFEYPLLAFVGVTLGMIARVLTPGVEAEMGLPLLIKQSLPIGITGLVLASYFSAIMSTADSCLIASSGNFVNDIIEKIFLKNPSQKQLIRLSQLVTLIIGASTVVIAGRFATVLEIILHAYAFMVSGLFIPTLGAFFCRRKHPSAALAGMLSGGGLTLFMIITQIPLPLGLDASFYGILLSALVFFTLNRTLKPKEG